MRGNRTNNSKIAYHEANLAAGFHDVGGEDGQELPRWYRYQNWRPGPDRSIVRRGGMQFVSQCARVDTSPSLDGATHFATVNLDATTHTLKKHWTFEALCKPTTFAAVRSVWDHDHASDYSLRGPYFTTGGKCEAKTQDSAGTVTTLTSATTFSAADECAIQVARNGTSVYLKVNGATEATGSMADLDGKAPAGNGLIGKSQAAAFFLGIIDFVRCFNIFLPDQRYGRIRWPYPRAEPVLWNYDMQDVLGGVIYDLSRFENHALTVDMSATQSSANRLCVAASPIFGLAQFLPRNGRPSMFVQAGASTTVVEAVR